MSKTDQSDENILSELVAYIDDLLRTCQKDIQEVNSIAIQLQEARLAGQISGIHYTVDQERLQRILSKAKLLVMTLLKQRKRAINMIQELQA